MGQKLVLRGDRAHAASFDTRLVQSLNSALSEQAPIAPGLAGRVFATESISEQEYGQLESVSSNFQAMLDSVIGELGGGQRTMVQESAAIAGALCASAASSFVKSDRSFNVNPSRNMIPVKADTAPDYLGHRPKFVAAEAFDNREVRSAVLYSMAYNYAVSRQDEFGETVWPTLTLPADQVGFGIVVNRLAIHRGLQHTVDGKVTEFKKIDLMRAEADHKVLLKERTRVFPIFRAAHASQFVDQAIIPAFDYDNEGITIKTAPLATGIDIGLLGISQTDAQLDGGMANQTDTLDPAISVEKLFVTLGADVFAFNVFGQPGANFVAAPQGLDKQRNLTMRLRSAKIEKSTTQFGGVAKSEAALVALDTDDLTLVLELNATGQSNTEIGSAVVYGNRVSIVKVLDADGVELPASDARVQDLQALVAGAKIIGWTPRAYKTNMNMRERGDFIDTTNFTQLYEVPLLSPCTAQRPVNTDGRLDTSDFEALVTHTRFRLKNDAVTAIFDACNRLADWSGTEVSPEDLPYALGAARFHVKPTFLSTDTPIDLAAITGSLSSVDRVKALQSTIVNLIRDYAFRLYVLSEYQAAKSSLGMQGPDTVIVATDPTIHRYIMVDGDLRTLTDKFNIRVVSTLDKRFEGKVFVTFGVFDESRNQAPNLLNWGNLVWAPEVVLSAQVPRGESMSRETIVQPRYLFVNHLPVAAMLEFTGIPHLFERAVPINWRELP
jgi:hypothetical protein